MNAGRMIAVVGPSGGGKDSLIAGAIRPGLVWARRVITRPSEAGGEPFEGVSEDEFLRRKLAGEFVLDWQAHGLFYGIPASVRGDLAAGRDVIFNGSRAELAAALAHFSGLIVVLVMAPQHVLAARLAVRGREAEADIARRLARGNFEMPAGIDVRVVDNHGTLEQGIARFNAAIQPVRA
jgi:ribose 1,5-bisphosphokinase